MTPDKWRDKQDIEHSGGINYKLSVKDLTKSIKDFKNADSK